MGMGDQGWLVPCGGYAPLIAPTVSHTQTQTPPKPSSDTGPNKHTLKTADLFFPSTSISSVPKRRLMPRAVASFSRVSGWGWGGCGCVIRVDWRGCGVDDPGCLDGDLMWVCDQGKCSDRLGCGGRGEVWAHSRA